MLVLRTQVVAMQKLLWEMGEKGSRLNITLVWNILFLCGKIDMFLSSALHSIDVVHCRSLTL